MESKESRKQGKCRWFSKIKGYGFLTSNDQEDIFFHYSAIQSDGFKTLNEGDKVEFDVKEGKSGMQAVNIVLIKE